jgi:predicted acylesterase/phospholipase RssA
MIVNRTSGYKLLHRLTCNKKQYSHTSDMQLRSLSLRTDNTSFAFSGCGWLTPFHLGAIDILMKEKYISNTTICAGSSGGALAALVACSGVEPCIAMDKIIELSHNKDFFRDIDKGLKDKSLMISFPSNIVERCNGRLFVTATKIWPNATSKVTIFSQYNSLDDILSCVAASSFIPFYSATRPFTYCRGEIYIDGGALSLMPELGDVRVSPLPAVFFSKRLKPHITPLKPFPVNELLKNGFIPPSEHVLKDIYNRGKESALHWCKIQERNA